MHDPHPTLSGSISALVVSFVLMMASMPAQGSEHDTMILVPRNTPSLTIPKSSLPFGGDNSPEVTIVSWSNPSRGTLAESAAAFTYTPEDAFRFKGSDSFRVRFLSEDSLSTATVFVVADLGPGDDDGNPFGETTAGGDTVLVLDIGTRWSPTAPLAIGQTRLSESRELLRAVDQENNIRFDLWLIDHFGGELILQARAFENGNDVIMLPPATISENSAVIHLDWWASRSGASNGGLLVRYNDVLVSHAVGLDNVFHETLRWTQVEPSPSVLDASVSILSTYERTAAVPMAFPPRFADSFEDGLLEAWLPGRATGQNEPDPSGVEIVAHAASDGGLGLHVDLAAGVGSTLRDESPGAVERYRARFDLRTDASCPGAADLKAESHVVLLAGFDAFSGHTLFELGILLAEGGAFHVTVRSVDDAGIWHEHTRPIAITAGATLDLEWWAAKSSPFFKGGLALRVNGTEAPWPSFSLNNVEQRLGSVQFGAVFPDAGANAVGPDTGSSRLEGSICLDEFEAWF